MHHANLLPLVDNLDACGQSFEELVDEVTTLSPQVLARSGDSTSITHSLRVLSRDWARNNRQHLHGMVAFLQRYGVIGIGGVQVPNSKLGEEKMAMKYMLE